MTSNRELLERSLRAVWHPCTQMKHHAGTAALPLVPIARGQGVWLHDFDGHRYLDGISSWWVNLFGHCHPRINAALRAQLDELEHVILAGFTQRPVVELSERLAALTGGSLGHCFFASDGASATEIALKMSFHSWQNRGHGEKREFLCVAGGYHGETVGALAVTDVALFRDAYAALIRPAGVVDSPDARLAASGESAVDVARRAASALELRLEREHQRIAALIVEPLIQCASGMAMHDPEYLRLARGLCDRYGVHLICDEIAVGCGRSGSFFAHEQAAIRPDFLCLSKGISGGYLPLSIVMTSDAVYADFYDDATSRGFLHSHSYTGNALACRAALATLDIFADEQVIERNPVLARHLGACLQPLAAHPHVRHLRQRGMIAAFDVVCDDPLFSRRFYVEALAQGILLRPIGNTIYFMPPYVISPDEIEFLVERATVALEAALRR
ncbi:adenosylmethionine--8-amino-7-oxononanoate transaminase [Accumulibacter sp.]|uniref:adenosylmethionine--8-amino-7-oxononanoate transaminase n=1 Tax=Accumulibacter sp. TaxID=2053492 RepID=UPI0025E69896|nr:adenosylmethionine--8-amino-7-oxononanoate transaminase [Accumulibacter sp.]MCM8611103.1 adenosylmethionine--8-amino-7-oxononanoate transaminase [Accumulibacter sp.]MCM8636217.1 adenosylmethionine--8-amino-7-oxononanoate transaminase [Accumulibacter sp.]MCM8640616.1 adenosylmethionine--8-amino-7-oxononanoate transaminase [Accumulibacter sp.]